MKTKFSILVPLYNTPERFLRDMIESVLGQKYKNWELCLADASDEKHTKVGDIVSEYAKKDSRIRYTKLKENGGISENTNACIEMSTGNYFALLDHDDVLDEKALADVARAINREHADIIYTDEAKFTDSIKEWFAPNYKPDFSKYELRAHNYICHLTVYSRELLDQVGRYRKECDGSQDHDMVLRLTEKAKRIVHIPRVLYYWRVHGESVSSGVENKSYAIDAAKKAVLEQVERSGGEGEVVTHEPFSLLYHVLYKIKGNPCVSVVLYGDVRVKTLTQCIESIEINSGYDNFEYLIFVSDRLMPSYREALEHMQDIHSYHLVEQEWKPAHETALNEFLKKYGKDHLLFLHASSRVTRDDFIRELLMLSQQEDVGLVGPKLYTAQDTIKNAGLALSKAAEGGIVYRFCGEPAESHGYEALLRHTREVTALSEDCMMVETQIFDQLGGFSGVWESYAGIDLCLRARSKGYRNIWTPYAEVVSFTEGWYHKKEEMEVFEKKWKSLFSKEDPYYNKFIRYDVDNLHDKNTSFLLMTKSLTYLREEGISGLLNRVNVYRGAGGQRSSSHITSQLNPVNRRVYKDVLFINGCAPSVPHPPRYRVTHQREQLEACNITTDEVYYEELNPDVVKYYRTFIFFRCPYTDNVGKLIERAKYLNRLVLFDIDDLVVDTKYTDTIPYVQSLNEDEKRIYDDGVIRMGKTLKLCDAAITTTECLAEELSHYVPEVLINRNTASERMYELSEKAVFERDILPYLDENHLPKGVTSAQLRMARKKNQKRNSSKVRIGYFSGSITHNADFDMIRPALVRILKEFPSVELHLVGELDLPEELNMYKEQIVAEPFTDWEKLPELIASVDINLAPITEGIFNEAKSENKWTEAALVKVPTVASNVGAFAVMIKDHETGLLCDTEEDWYQALKRLVTNREERICIAQAACDFVHDNCITLYTGKKLSDYIKRKRQGNLAFVLPSTEISGGILVALKHASFLKKNGMDVFLINDGIKTQDITFENTEFPVLSAKNTDFLGKIDQCVGTMWSTVWFLQVNTHIQKRYYLVQNYETDFYEPNHPLRVKAEQTYHFNDNLRYLTISKWCEKWLLDRYGVSAAYMPNGIDISRFYPCERKFDGKIRILIEGDSSVYYKNVDESFRIVEGLDKERYEIWYVSYEGKAKDWYHVDQSFNRVPHAEMPDLYRECHILLKSSILESFSYPPLEMMATGGYVVVVPNGGNVEYLRDGENCLMYPQGDLDAARDAIERICKDEILRSVLYVNGVKTACKRDWTEIETDITRIYK